MIHLDLFSGIGGFAYAADQVFGDVEHIFVDNDSFCQKVLEKHWPGSLIYGNIKELAWHIQAQKRAANGGKKTKIKSGNTGENTTIETGNGYLSNPETGLKQGDLPNEKQSSRPTAEDVSVAEKLTQLFSPSTISTATEPPNENNMELRAHIAELSKQDFQAPTNFSVSTATALKEFWDYVRTKPIDLLTGGFPCQPFSAAGLRKGKEDDRFLWPHMLAVIKATKPTWVIAENVRGIINIHDGMVFEQVCADLEAEGYEVQPFIIPAVAVNAPHRRDRIWFVGHIKDTGSLRGRGRNYGNPRRSGWQVQTAGSGGTLYEDDTNPQHKGLQGSQRPGAFSQRTGTSRPVAERSWDENWLEVATELCRVDDGLPTGLDGFELTKAGHRVQRLKSLGNAIVPQVAMEIMRGML